MKVDKGVDGYIANFPEEVRGRLEEIRRAIKEGVPGIGEKISYGVPTATLEGKYLIYFAGYKKHISIYPVTPGMEAEIEEISKYRTGKGTLQFPLDEELPMALIRKIIKVRVKESLVK